MSGVKYESKPLPLNRDHHVSGGTIRFHFDVPTPKVTVFRRNQNQDQETGQEPVRWTRKVRQVANGESRSWTNGNCCCREELGTSQRRAFPSGFRTQGISR